MDARVACVTAVGGCDLAEARVRQGDIVREARGHRIVVQISVGKGHVDECHTENIIHVAVCREGTYIRRAMAPIEVSCCRFESEKTSPKR